jgi:hypothetical protein
VNVLGGYLCPLSDSKLFHKFYNKEKTEGIKGQTQNVSKKTLKAEQSAKYIPISAVHRIKLCELIARDDKWLMVDKW